MGFFLATVGGLRFGKGMSYENLRLGALVVALVGVVGIPSAVAELPTLGEKKWLGHFIGFENKKFGYGFMVQGKSFIKVVGSDGEPLTRKLAVQVEFLVEEILPDGKPCVRQLLPESLESLQPAGKEPKNVVIRGKVKGDTRFEISVDEHRGVISLGGRLLDKGPKGKNPVRFSIRMKFPNAYPYAKRSGDKQREEAFEEKIRNDRMSVTWTDGKRVKQATDQVIDAGSEGINGPGISALQVEFSSYAGKKIGCVASVNSVMMLSGKQAGPLHDGFVLTWTADPVKDVNGLARLSFDVR